jgi:hypothetical protein
VLVLAVAPACSKAAAESSPRTAKRERVSTQRSDTPQGAQGETLIRMINCDVSGKDCFVTARFADLDGCMRHKKLSDAYCDSVSTPGKIICDTHRQSLTTKSYCLP